MGTVNSLVVAGVMANMQVIIMLVKCYMPQFGTTTFEDFQGFCEMRIQSENLHGRQSLEPTLRSASQFAQHWAGARAKMRFVKAIGDDGDECSEKLLNALVAKVRSEVVQFQIVTIPD